MTKVNNLLNSHIFVGYKRSLLEKFSCNMNPGLALLTDWIISSGNTALSVDRIICCLEQLHRDDIVEVVQKGQGIDAFHYYTVVHKNVAANS